MRKVRGKLQLPLSKSQVPDYLLHGHFAFPEPDASKLKACESTTYLRASGLALLAVAEK